MYSQLLYGWYGLPLHEELFQEGTPLGRWDCLTEENYQELCELRGQITNANFKSERTYMLNGVLGECSVAEALGTTIEKIVHETYEDMQRRVRE